MVTVFLLGMSFGLSVMSLAFFLRSRTAIGWALFVLAIIPAAAFWLTLS